MDLLILETGNGGDLVLRGNDLATVEGMENMPYLGMFGGDADWWGNELFFRDQPKLKMSSETEKTLQTVVLNSSGRIKIENAIAKDLADLAVSSGSELNIEAVLSAPDRLEIKVQFNGRQLQYVWNPAEESLRHVI